MKEERGDNEDDDDDDFIEIPHPDDSEQMALNQFVPEVASYFPLIVHRVLLYFLFFN